MGKNTQSEAGKAKNRSVGKTSKKNSSEKKGSSVKPDEFKDCKFEDGEYPQEGDFVVNVYLAPDGATEEEIRIMEDGMNGTDSANGDDMAYPVYTNVVENTESTESPEGTEKENTMNEDTNAEMSEAAAMNYEETPPADASNEMGAEAENAEDAPAAEAAEDAPAAEAAEDAPAAEGEPSAEVQNGRKISAVLKKNACAAIRDVIEKGSLAEHINNEDFLNVLKLAVGYKDEPAEKEPKGPRRRMNGKLQGIEDMFTTGDGVSEFALFEKFSIGRAEMMAIRRKFATKENAAERLYLALDTSAKVWKLVGTGENMPEGFHLQTRRPKDNV